VVLADDAVLVWGGDVAHLPDGQSPDGTSLPGAELFVSP
jgi:hypothetical protein